MISWFESRLNCDNTHNEDNVLHNYSTQIQSLPLGSPIATMNTKTSSIGF